MTSAKPSALESIAEDLAEPSAPLNNITTASTTTSSSMSRADDDGDSALVQRRHRLAPLEPAGSRAGSVSPAPSEANASIDLGAACETPLSAASIDIQDHSQLLPTDRMASVLHHRPAPLAPGEPTGQWPLPEVVEPQPPVGGEPVADTSPAIGNSSPALGAEDAESAAAIRIQSAFRGYKTRKHSPYRRRSPAATSEPSNNQSNGRASNGLATGTGGRAEVVEPSQQDHLGPGRSSRQRLQEGEEAAAEAEAPLGTLQQAQDLDPANIIRAAPSFEEFTESTVREAARQLKGKQEVAPPALRVGLEEQESSATASVTVPEATTTTSFSLDQPPADEAADYDADSPSAGCCLKSVVSTANEEPLPAAGQQQRPSLGTLSVELDTDSSNLGAALSLNEEMSSEPPGVGQQVVGDERPAMEPQQRQMGYNEADNENDKSLGLISDELASEARRLVEELTAEEEEEGEEVVAGSHKGPPEGWLLDEATAGEAPGTASMSLEQQLTIELESDDIERRDPRGQASEARAKSPPILVEAGPALEVDVEQAAEPEEEEEDGEEVERLRVEERAASGRSSPALNSSNCNSSSEGEGEGEGEDQGAGSRSGGEQRQQQQQQQQQQQKARNRRRNRNKMRGKK